MNNWTKTTVCSPTFRGEYLVVLTHSRNIIITEYDDDLGSWLEFDDSEISHWQDLPELPKEKEND